MYRQSTDDDIRLVVYSFGFSLIKKNSRVLKPHVVLGERVIRRKGKNNGPNLAHSKSNFRVALSKFMNY